MNKKIIWGVVIAVVAIVVGVCALKTVAFVTCYSDWEPDNCYVDTFPYFGKSIVEQYATTTPGYFKKINIVSTSDWKTYINNEFGFQFNYPQFSKITEESIDLKKPTKQINISLSDPIKKGYVAKVIMKINYFPVFECSQNAPKQTINGNIFNVVKGRQQGSDMIGKDIYYIIHNNYCYEIHSSTIEGPTAASQTDLAEIDNYLESILLTFKFTFSTTTTPQSSIKILSPNGGETLYIGKQQKITWIDDRDVSNVFIFAINKDKTGLGSNISGNISVRSSGIDGRSSYVWNIGSIYPTSDSLGMPVAQDNVYPGEYKLNICNRDTKKCDLSDNYFTIAIDSTLAPSITLLSPKNGETVKIGTSFPIYWNTNRIIPLGYKFIINAGSGDRVFDAYSATTSYNYYYLADKYRVSGDIFSDVTPGQYKIKISLYDGVAPKDANGKTCMEKPHIFCNIPDQYGKLVTESTSDNYVTFTN